ncbi:hypothetical protein LOTGIDRAFT_168088, partial [Lottia gigantea]
EKKRFVSVHGKNTFEDEDDCKQNLQAYQNFVLGNPSAADEGLYPLPHNAYSERNKASNGAEKDDSTVEIYWSSGLLFTAVTYHKLHFFIVRDMFDKLLFVDKYCFLNLIY